MIRRATLEDSPAIYLVHMAAIRQVAASHYTPQQLEAWCGKRSPESYHESILEKDVLVEVSASGVQGFGQLDRNTSTVQAVYASPASLRQGIGTRLLAQLEVLALRHGINALSLDSSLNAVSFYASAGYARVGAAEHELLPGVSIPCVTMRKQLALDESA